MWRLKGKDAAPRRSDSRSDGLRSRRYHYDGWEPLLLEPRISAADADRISPHLRRACDQEIPCRAILLPRVSLPLRFAFEQTQNLSSAGCADSLQPLRFARVQHR